MTLELLKTHKNMAFGIKFQLVCLLGILHDYKKTLARLRKLQNIIY